MRRLVGGWFEPSPTALDIDHALVINSNPVGADEVALCLPECAVARASLAPGIPLIERLVGSAFVRFGFAFYPRLGDASPSRSPLRARLGKGFQQPKQEPVTLLGFASLIAHGREGSMAEEPKKPIVPHTDTPTSFESLPATDPAVLREMESARLGQIHYAAIGRVAAAWSRFEFHLDGWNMTLADLPDGIGACFTAQVLGSRGRVDCFIALVRHLGASGKWNTQLEEFATEVVKLGEQRNRAVHDIWQLDNPSEPHRLEVSAKRSVRIAILHVPTRWLLDLEAKIIAIDARFHGLAAQI
jgi:hypothetical protein